jgi:tetratricopeptide (TPR) repeat protein
MGRYSAAWGRLQQARALGVTHPEFAFELGWSLVNLQRWADAVTQLETYERAHPGRGQTSEFLGRAQLGLKQYDAAMASFDEALRRDPRLKPTVHFYQALLEQQRGNAEAARTHVQSILQESPNSPVARAVNSQLATLAILENPPAPQGQSGKPWRISVSLGGGHNSNVIFLGSGIA